MVVPLLWLLSGYKAPSWAFDQESLNHASADVCGWIPNMLALAARPKTYMEHITFMVNATGEATFSVLLTGAFDSVRPLQVPTWTLWFKVFHLVSCLFLSIKTQLSEACRDCIQGAAQKCKNWLCFLQFFLSSSLNRRSSQL